jgi:hypothetical protein
MENNFKKRLLMIQVLILAVMVSCLMAGEEMRFYGTSDASAGVFLDPNHFAAADDESNFLRIYAISCPEKLVGEVDLSAFLEVQAESPEADIEGAARIGDRIYWITSHGRNKDGKLRTSRYRFFATQVKAGENGKTPWLIPEGMVCKTLAEQMLAYMSPVQEAIKAATQFDAALSKKELAKLAPKEKGLNVEGLCWYPPNKSLLIGLRNPLYKAKGQQGGRSIVLELLNPQEVIEQGIAARFGQVLLWDLGGRGIRGMEYGDAAGRFYILAGAVDSETTSAVFEWDGESQTSPELIYEWPEGSDFTPEGLAEREDGSFWLFSDDGSLKIAVESPEQCQPGELLPDGTCPNKFLRDSARKSFRIRVLK